MKVPHFFLPGDNTVKGDGFGSNWVSLCSVWNQADAQQREVFVQLSVSGEPLNVRTPLLGSWGLEQRRCWIHICEINYLIYNKM